MPRKVHSSPPPLKPNGLLTVGVITACWVVALAVLFFCRDYLDPQDRWWTWVCVAGVVLGVVGMGYFFRSPYKH
ncbi:MAG: DUF2530 domain-containing protein [Streptosporangiales bacterium]